MEPQKTNKFNTVTTLSRILAACLFVVLPFVGLYIGYTFASQKVVEVERVVVKEIEVLKEVSVNSDLLQSEISESVSLNLAQEDVIDYLNSNNIIPIHLDQSVSYLSINTQVYALWNSGGSYDGIRRLHSLEGVSYTSIQVDDQIQVKEMFLAASEKQVPLLLSGADVYFKDQVLEELNAQELILDEEKCLIRDKDTIYSVNFGLRGLFFSKENIADAEIQGKGCN